MHFRVLAVQSLGHSLKKIKVMFFQNSVVFLFFETTNFYGLWHMHSQSFSLLIQIHSGSPTIQWQLYGIVFVIMRKLVRYKHKKSRTYELQQKTDRIADYNKMS